MTPPIREAARNKEILREQHFLEHLEVLRGVLIHSTIAFLVVSITCTFFSARILDLLVSDLPIDHLNFFSPTEAFMVRMKMSFVTGAIVSFPYILFRVWGFLAPAFFRKERHRVLPMLVASSALFYVGIVFCYVILIPLVLKFVLGFGTQALVPVLSVSAYFDWVARLTLTFGLVFQLPVVILILTGVGIITPTFLLRQWRWAVLIIFTAAAVLTPPDVASQVLMAVPLLLLYIGSVLVAMIVTRKRKRVGDR